MERKNLKNILKNFKESCEIFSIRHEIQRLKNFYKNEDNSRNFDSVFFILHNLLKKLGPFLEVNIFSLISNESKVLGQENFKRCLTICKKLDCSLNFLSFKEDIFFNRFLAHFSNGSFGVPEEKPMKIIYSGKFLQILLNLFWIDRFNRELFIRPVRVKSVNFNYKSSILKNTKKCGSCGSFFRILFSNCILCGKKFFV